MESGFSLLRSGELLNQSPSVMCEVSAVIIDTSHLSLLHSFTSLSLICLGPEGRTRYMPNLMLDLTRQCLAVIQVFFL
ncbi:hypothetical protein D3C84_1083850 [compost metagenome]